MKQVLLTRWALPFPVCLFMESFPCSRYSATHSDYRFKTIMYFIFSFSTLYHTVSFVLALEDLEEWVKYLSIVRCGCSSCPAVE